MTLPIGGRFTDYLQVSEKKGGLASRYLNFGRKISRFFGEYKEFPSMIVDRRPGPVVTEKIETAG